MRFELPVIFHSQGVPLVGRFIRNTASFQERQPAVIVMGSWLTVKEQMARTYGLLLAEKGYAASSSISRDSVTAAAIPGKPRSPLARSWTSWPRRR